MSEQFILDMAEFGRPTEPAGPDSICLRGELDVPELGPCCICKRSGPNVRNILQLHKKAPIPGRGWGCVQCGIPADGALAVVCDECVDEFGPDGLYAQLLYACRGYPGDDGRVPIADLVGEHDHRMAYHPEAS